VRAVADRIVVLRLGRNNGTFPADASSEQLVSAITGAHDNAVTRRSARRTRGAHDGSARHDPAATAPPVPPAPEEGGPRD
jgi:ABC-type sugar transport system ATPase subunit